MRLNRLLLLACFVFPSIGFAQNSTNWDVGIKLGAADGLCAIGGINTAGKPSIINIQPSQIRWDFGVYARYKLSSRFSVAANFDYLRLQGFDSLSKVTVIRDRNLNYRNDIAEASIRLEWTFFQITDIGGYYNYKNSFNAFLYVGAGIFHMNPEAMITESNPSKNIGYSYGDYVPLRTLTTEGEARYSLIQATIPMGVGFHYTINRTYILGMDFGWNKTFTGYIDDVYGKYPSYGVDVNLPNPYTKYMTNQSFFVPGITKAELAQYGPGSPRGDGKDGSWITAVVTLGIVIHSKSSTASRRKEYYKYKSRASF